MTKICATCKKSFDALTNRSKYCSEKCSRHKKYYKQKTMLRKNCKNCNKVFMTRRTDKKFCCILCKNYYHKVKPIIIRTCLECGGKFTTGKTYQFYCSKSCYSLAKNRRSKKEYQERRRRVL